MEEPIIVKKPHRKLIASLWTMGAACVSLAATVVGLGVAYSKLKEDCKSNDSQTSSSTTTSAAAPAQFTAKSALMIPLNGLNSTIDWHYDSVYGREMLSFNNTIEFRKDYVSGVTEMYDPANISETCVGYPMTSTTMNSFEYESAEPAGFGENAKGEACQRYHAKRPDGTVFYFSRGDNGLCSMELNGIEYRFHPEQFYPGVLDNNTLHLCRERHVDYNLQLVHVQWGWHWHPSWHPSWLNPRNWWQRLKCDACTRGIGWVMGKINGELMGNVCMETGPFVSACQYLVRDVENKVCGGSGCVNKACQDVHLC